VNGALPEDVLDELLFLNSLASKANGVTPLDAPERKAGDDLCKLVLDVVSRYNVPMTRLSVMMGLSPANLRLKLGRRGYVPLPPSQRGYKGVVHDMGGPRKAVCKRGHALTDETVYRTKDGGRRCKACSRAASNAYKAAKRHQQ
jgi:hypothetical protein